MHFKAIYSTMQKSHHCEVIIVQHSCKSKQFAEKCLKHCSYFLKCLGGMLVHWYMHAPGSR